MKYENLFKIYIPEPCHEDWNKMMPNEQGAFCKSCAKTVVDFSDKTEGEIQKFLSDNIDNKICGRFRINQLDKAETEEIPRLKIEKPKFEFPGFLIPVLTPFRAYAMAMMLFAAVALQSCGNSNEAGGDDIKLAGAVAYVDSTKTYLNDDDILVGRIAPKYNQNNNTDSACNAGDDNITVGKIRAVENTDTLKTDTTETMIKGEIEPVQKTHGILIKKQNEKEDYKKGDVRIERKEE